MTGIFQKSPLELLFAKIYLRSVAYNKLKYPYNPESQKKKKNPLWEFWVIFSCDHYLSPSTEEFCLFQSVCDPSRAWRRRANSFPDFGGMYLVRIFYYVSVSISLRVRLAHAKGDGGREGEALFIGVQWDRTLHASRFLRRILPWKKKSLPHFIILNYYLQVILSG